jgi:hypothetical protein
MFSPQKLANFHMELCCVGSCVLISWADSVLDSDCWVQLTWLSERPCSLQVLRYCSLSGGCVPCSSCRVFMAALADSLSGAQSLWLRCRLMHSCQAAAGSDKPMHACLGCAGLWQTQFYSSTDPQCCKQAVAPRARQHPLLA